MDFRNTKRGNLIFGSCTVIILLFLDQLTKALASGPIKNDGPITLIPKVLSFSYLENQSAAFSFDPITLIKNIFSIQYFDENPQAFLNCKMGFFVVLTFTVCLLICFVYSKLPTGKRFNFLRITLIMLLSGAVGNLIDRIRLHYVIDFIYFELIDFPVFNVADIYVTVATVLLIILILFYYKEEDLKAIGLFRK